MKKINDFAKEFILKMFYLDETLLPFLEDNVLILCNDSRMNRLTVKEFEEFLKNSENRQLFCRNVEILQNTLQEICKHNWYVTGRILLQDIYQSLSEMAEISFIILEKEGTYVVTSICVMYQSEIVSSNIRQSNKNLLVNNLFATEMAHQKKILKHIVDNTGVSYWEYDILKKCIYQGGDSIDKHGFSTIVENVPESLVESKYVHPDSAEAFKDMYQKLIDGEPDAEGIFRVKNGNHSDYWYEKVSYTTEFDQNGKPIKAFGISTNVTMEVEKTMTLQERAEKDLLTGCYNKITMISKIERLMKEYEFGLLIEMDIDDFKLINDKFGHHYGDQVLKSVSDALQEVFRNTDVIGRFGGDEFLVYVPTNEIQLDDWCNKIAERIQKEMKIRDENMKNKTTLSIGMSRFPFDGSTYQALYEVADKELYRSKKKGKNCYTLSSGT